MIFANVKSITIPEGIVTKIVAAGVTIWQAVVEGYKNWVPYSTTSDGTTIYNGTGYKYGYRIRSGGAEGTASYSTCTGFIPVSGGDTVRVSGCNFAYESTGNAINVSDSSFTNIGQITPSYAAAGYGIFASGAAYQSYSFSTVTEETSGVWKWVVPPAASGIAYIRVTAHDCSNSGASLIVTVNQEIT